MKIHPIYTFWYVFFFFNFSIMSFPKFARMTKTHPFFSNFAWFCTPKQCTHVHRLVLENNPNVIFFMKTISNFKCKCPPPHPGQNTNIYQALNNCVLIKWIYIQIVVFSHYVNRRGGLDWNSRLKYIGAVKEEEPRSEVTMPKRRYFQGKWYTVLDLGISP